MSDPQRITSRERVAPRRVEDAFAAHDTERVNQLLGRMSSEELLASGTPAAPAPTGPSPLLRKVA